MPDKTYHTAVVVVPPQECWAPIQAIRQRHDRQVRRWMPHITLLYPFRPASEFDVVVEPLRQSCAAVAPFEITLRRFDRFCHGRGRHTLWLAPEPAEAVSRLQSSLQAAVHDCDDVSRYPGGFSPHLSVGQASGDDAAADLQAELQSEWQPLTFVVSQISLIRRSPPPEDVFRVDRSIDLG
jgi:2'-5' RNA ligase